MSTRYRLDVGEASADVDQISAKYRLTPEGHMAWRLMSMMFVGFVLTGRAGGIPADLCPNPILERPSLGGFMKDHPKRGARSLAAYKDKTDMLGEAEAKRAVGRTSMFIVCRAGVSIAFRNYKTLAVSRYEGISGQMLAVVQWRLESAVARSVSWHHAGEANSMSGDPTPQGCPQCFLVAGKSPKTPGRSGDTPIDSPVDSQGTCCTR